MKYIFFLSGDYTGLGREEIISLLPIDKCKSAGRLLIADSEESKLKVLRKRLALTKNIYRYLFECEIDGLIEIMKGFNWNSVYSDNFCLRIEKLNEINDKISITENSNVGKNIKNEFNKNTNKKIKNEFTEKKLAAYVWRSLSNPKVDLENPKTLIQLFIIKGKVYCGLLIYTNKEDFDSRKSHLRPFPHPSSLHPKVARALINLTGIKEGEILLDPFCGTGGILMEAGLINIKSIGYDINKIMINGCTENLKYFKIKNYKVKKRNALKISDKFDNVVTDLPYGLNSNAITHYEKKDWKRYRLNKKIQTKNFARDLEKFYLKFLINLRKKLKKGRKAVIVFPSYVNYRKILKKSKFKIEKEFSNYVHRSLTRKIVKIR